MQRRAVALAVRTEGDAVAEHSENAGPRILEVAICDGQSQCTFSVPEAEESLRKLVCDIEVASGAEALLVCRGAWELRQILVPLCVQHRISLPALFTTFLNMSRVEEYEYPDEIVEEARMLVERVTKIGEGAALAAVEEITVGVKHGICHDDEKIDDDLVVRARGLPWQSTDEHVAMFFAGLNIAPGGVALCLSSEGRRNGEALVRFTTPEHRALALKRHRQFLLTRYIEVYRASGEEFLQVAAGCTKEVMAFITRGAAVIIRMRGLPYDCTEEQIREFFANGALPVEVMDNGIMFVTRPDGRPTGDAFVLFADETSGGHALTKHRRCIGSRYIELFRSTPAEVNQVMKKSAEMLPGANGVRRDCIRLRGLPYEARVEDVVRFLGEHARNIVFQGVHMVYNAQGHPSGECFIQTNSERAAAETAAATHNKFMTTNKKQRYIEVFQCSPDDMHLVISAPSGAAPPLVIPQPRLPFVTPQQAPMPLHFPGVYWPYPSPPVSPNLMLASHGSLFITGIGLGVTPQDIANQFSGPDSVVESVQMLRWPTATLHGEAVIRLRVQGMQEQAPLFMDQSQLAQFSTPLFPLVHT